MTSPRSGERRCDDLAAGILTVEDVARAFRLTPGGVRAAIRRGDLPAARVGRRLYVRRSDLDALFRPQAAPRTGAAEAAVRSLRGLPARRAPA